MRRMSPILVLAILAPVGLAESDISRLKLRPQATVYGNVVRLADVLVFADANPELEQQVGEKPVAAGPQDSVVNAVSHDQIVRRMDELGVNMSRVLVSGAAICRITYGQTPAAPSDEKAGDDLISPPRTPESEAAGTEKTLADMLRAHVNTELTELRGTAEVHFERGGEEFLELTAPPWEFKVSSSGTDKLGLREFRVVIRRDGRVQRTAQILAQVRIRRPVVVARRPLSIGNLVRSEDVGLETRVFDSTDKLGLPGVEAVVGQQVKRFVPAGEMVQPDAIKAVDLVSRSRPVTVLGAKPNVQVRLTGIALDSGGYGDSVRVRLGDSRKTQQQLRGVVTGLGTVRLVEHEE